MVRRKRESPQEGGGAPEWMTTYSDLVTLLLCFFVLLFSMAVIDKQKFIEVANSLRSSFSDASSGGDRFDTNKGKDLLSLFDNNKPGNVNSENDNEVNDDKGSDQESLSEAELEKLETKKLEKLQKQLQTAITELKLDEYVKVIIYDNEIILRIDSVVLFDSGSADIKASGHEVLKKTGLLLKEVDNEIFIQGHTDNLPINTQLFPTNWELSTKRATNVTLFMISTVGLNPEKLTATGNGEYRPINSNDTENNRQKNRRIDIVIVRN